jgi:hypothetical protein
MATLSKVRIANMALSNIGARSSIESFTENSSEAQQIDLWYDFSLLQTLEAFDWSFARKRQILALHSDPAPDTEWCFRYQYPADCVSARYIVNPLGKDADPVPFSVETSVDGSVRTILTNQDVAELVYTFDLQTVSLFSPLFVKALAYALGANIAFALTAKTAIEEKMQDRFARTILLAPASNANEEQEDPPREAEWIRGRD